MPRQSHRELTVTAAHLQIAQIKALMGAPQVPAVGAPQVPAADAPLGAQPSRGNNPIHQADLASQIEILNRLLTEVRDLLKNGQTLSPA